MQRAYYLAGWGWVAISALLVYRASHPELYHPREPLIPAVQLVDGSNAATWFARIKPSCNSLEVELLLQQNAPPAGWEGSGYAASCYAIAGRIDRARTLIIELPEAERSNATSIVFNIGHPIADMGDDASAGPIMRLVVEFQPWNYMAQYHAGMSYYTLGDFSLAKRHLDQFLAQYDVRDGWRSNAIEVLGRLQRDGVR